MSLKNSHTGYGIKKRYARTSAEGKAEIITLLDQSGLPRIRALAQLRLPRGTYYRWLKRLAGGHLKDKKGGSPIPWNKIRPEEEARIFSAGKY